MENKQNNCSCTNCNCSNICSCNGNCSIQTCCNECNCQAHSYHQKGVKNTNGQYEDTLNTTPALDKGTIRDHSTAQSSDTNWYGDEAPR